MKSYKEELEGSDPKVKRILCYGDSNTWGWVPSSMGSERYNSENRWPGVAQKILGYGYKFIEEGLGARTTAFDDPRPEFPLRNGADILPIVLESHLPLDLVIIMLGTTDSKEMLDLNAKEITNGMRKLIKIVKSFRVLDGCSTPKVLIVVPATVNEKTDFSSKLFRGGTSKTEGLIEAYKTLAEDEKVYYLNPTDEVKVDSSEGVHIDNKNHKKLGKIVAEKVKSMMEED